MTGEIMAIPVPDLELPKNGSAVQAPPPQDVKPEPPKQVAAIVPVQESAITAGEPSRTLSAFASEDAFKGAYRMARAMSCSSLVPAAYQGENNIPNVLIAMELANRIGASVLMVMQSLNVIHGRPSWESKFLIATVNSSGRFTPLRFRFQGKEGTDDWGCRAVAKDVKTGEECVGSLITLKMAKEEGWSGKNGSKWKTMPEQMLIYRAASFWTRVYAPELSLGMQTREEIVDTTGVDVPDMPSSLAPGNAKALEAALMGGDGAK
jgi:hypothetical protein